MISTPLLQLLQSPLESTAMICSVGCPDCCNAADSLTLCRHEACARDTGLAAGSSSSPTICHLSASGGWGAEQVGGIPGHRAIDSRVGLKAQPFDSAPRSNAACLAASSTGIPYCAIQCLRIRLDCPPGPFVPAYLARQISPKTAEVRVNMDILHNSMHYVRLSILRSTIPQRATTEQGSYWSGASGSSHSLLSVSRGATLCTVRSVLRASKMSLTSTLFTPCAACSQ